MTDDELVDEIDVRSTARDHGEFGIKTLEIELADDALMALAYEKPSRAGLEFLLDESELPLGEPKALAVVVPVRIQVREEHLGRGLLDDRAADGAGEDIARALRGERHDAVQLPPRLGSILREALEGGIREQPPELIHPTHEPSAIKEMPHEMKEIERDGGAAHFVIEEIRDIEPHDRVTRAAWCAREPRDDEILFVVEDPGVVAPCHRTPGR